MTKDFKAAYQTIMDDHFTAGLELSFIDGDRKQTLVYAEVSWLIGCMNKSLRYGENPGQESVRYGR
jgi:AICAR transformylase/IMP cyclohydrolase PurH